MPRKSSAVWRFFNKDDVNRATCNLCGKSCSTSGNTTNIANHLKSKHLDAFESLNSGILEDTSNVENAKWDGTEHVIESEITETKKPVVKKRKRKNMVLECSPENVHREESFFNYNNNNNSNNSFSASSEFETELDIFGRSISAQLKKLPERKAIKLTLQINNMIGRARIEEIDEQGANKGTSGDNPHVITVSYEKQSSNVDVPYLK
ncbi:hypothetical protein Anas_03342 [Armadillidium nasatum]|uniref:BED-type domain-containing protein n=1 Tax=Armadillidium nasatum TaxID=96803 RepID=A0A5N5TDX9_9CRUS|nr:hypothetical protein Anas_03342 [Armadillidium nasatum]